MTSAIDGLVSGLDTTSLISQPDEARGAAADRAQDASSPPRRPGHRPAERQHQGRLARRRPRPRRPPPRPGAPSRATSSSASATASAGATAQPGSLTFTVDQVAKRAGLPQHRVADDGSLCTDSPPTLTVRKADGTYLTVEPASGSLADVAAAINKATDAGVRATVVRVSHRDTPVPDPVHRDHHRHRRLLRGLRRDAGDVEAATTRHGPRACGSTRTPTRRRRTPRSRSGRATPASSRRSRSPPTPSRA